MIIPHLKINNEFYVSQLDDFYSRPQFSIERARNGEKIYLKSYATNALVEVEMIELPHNQVAFRSKSKPSAFIFPEHIPFLCH